MRSRLLFLKKAGAMVVPRKYLVVAGKPKRNCVALTFDDGPQKYFTENVLDVLKEKQVRATFFMVGKNVLHYPELAQRAFNEGHLIGSHGFYHRSATRETLIDFVEDVAEGNLAIKKTIGQGCLYFRPPWGEMSLDTFFHLIKQKTTIVLWSIDSRDHERKSVAYVMNNVLKDRPAAGDIILFHDDNLFTLEALPRIIDELRAREFEFVGVDEMVK